MAQVLESTEENLPSNSSSVVAGFKPSSPTQNDCFYQQQTPQNNGILRDISNCLHVVVTDGDNEDIHGVRVRERKRRKRHGLGDDDQRSSLIREFVKVFKKSLFLTCATSNKIIGEKGEEGIMEIGMPMDVKHVSHVTYDCFNGFVGLPRELEIQVSKRPPSASTRVFGVSTASMHLSFDSKGNSVPTILLLMQSRLYAQGGLQAEGIFRINPENGQEEYVREQLNMGLVPDNVDIHCLASLIKAWFRELPSGLLDSLETKQVMQARSEEDYNHLIARLQPTESHLLRWAIDLMADVAQLQHLNKMNARNIATVFAPNMTQISDPMIAISYAIQLKNILKTLVERTLRDREAAPSHENGDHSLAEQINHEKDGKEDEETEEVQLITPAKDLPRPPCSGGDHEHNDNESKTNVIITRDEKENLADYRRDATVRNAVSGQYQSKSKKKKTGHSSTTTAKMQKNAPSFRL